MFLVALMVLSSFSEAASIGALLPFIWYLSGDAGRISSFVTMDIPIFNYLMVNKETELFVLTFLFVSVFFIASLIRVVVLWASTRLSQMLAADLAIHIYGHALGLDYEHHLKNNSSQAMSGVLHKANSLIVGVVFPIITMINAVLVFLAIFISLLFIHAFAAISSSLFFGVFYLLVLYLSKLKIQMASKNVNFGENKILQLLQEGYKGLKEINVLNRQNFFIDKFIHEEVRYRRAVSDIQIYSTVPKIFAETFGVFTIVALAIYLKFESDNFIEVVPVLGALALGAQRLLPIMQMVYSSISLVRGHTEQVSEIIGILQLRSFTDEAIQVSKLDFNEAVVFDKVSLSLGEDKAKLILDNVSLSIKKGSKVALTGETGSGKSSFLNVLLGLFLPSKGELYVDNIKIEKGNIKSWKKVVSVVPQEIILLDGSIYENIIFGKDTDKFSDQKIKQILRDVELDKFIESLPDGVHTRVGENGALLSGGQRQRIGLARGLFNSIDLLVLDEATSALDNKTEKRVLKNICDRYENLTMIFVTHNKSNFTFFSDVFVCSQGRIRSFKGASLNSMKAATD